MSSVPACRIRAVRDLPPRGDGGMVLYWMVASRRLESNFGLQRAAEWARELRKPLVILEPLRSGYRWASERLHRFVLDGMADHAAAKLPPGVNYYPYVEPNSHAGEGLLETLAEQAAVIVTDDYPCFFLPALLRWAGRQLAVRLEAVDSNGLLPISAPEDRIFTMAFHFRRWLQKNLRPHLEESAFPEQHPLQGLRLPPMPAGIDAIFRRWPRADIAALRAPGGLAGLPFAEAVPPGAIAGGPVAAKKTLATFLASRLPRYADERNQPEEEVASGLSPYLHFGHISVHEIFREAVQKEGWSTRQIASTSDGSSHGWWGASGALESFLDELITWREIGFNFCACRRDYDQFESLPDWCQKTLNDHASDPRQHLYTHEKFEQATTHDSLWNAAQRQLVREGRMHNYLRMLWGKKVLEWSPTPRAALATLIELNNKYALDGRDPNSYSGIFWCFGRYDRPWAPQRPIFGTIRYMSSDNTARKVRVKQYLQKYGPQPQARLLL